MMKLNRQVSIQIFIIISFVLFLLPHSGSSFSPRSEILVSPGNDRSYAVIIDAGSSGSRIHVYCFDQNMNLVKTGNEVEFYVQTKPGLSAYESNPELAAESLSSMLQQAEGFVPKELHSETPVRLGATAGLRLLKGDAPERILEAVRNFLKEKSPFKYKPEWVTVLKGSEEGSYLWETANYLEGNLGKKYSESAGVVDLGGGSVQMAYAISEEHAAKAPKPSDGEEPYVNELFFKGSKYYLYVHSYLHYGLLAARAEILKAVKGYGNPCILKDYHGFYKYGGETYEVSASPSGSNLYRCRRAALKALKVNESTCPNLNCTFGGIWNGGGGPGQKNLFVASFFFDRASQVGFIDPKLPAATVRPVDFERAAKRACIVKFETAKYVFPGVGVDDLPYICMDLVYQFTLLVDGFGLDPQKEITLVTRFNYLGSQIGAAWPLGSAIEILSSSSSPASLVLGPGLDVYI